MKWLLVLVALSWVGYILSFRNTDHGDNFGAGILSLALLATAVLLTIAYGGIALWLHCFW